MIIENIGKDVAKNSILCSDYGVQSAAATFFQFGVYVIKSVTYSVSEILFLPKFLPLHRGGI